jgi:hypothetical protein
MTLQQQLSRETPETAEDEAFNSRLSRVVSKLFTRVIKAEEGTSDPFSEVQFDLEAIVCFMEDLLVASEEMTSDSAAGPVESVDACRDMVNTLVQATVTAHGGTEYIQKHLDALGLDRHSSPLGRIIDKFEVPPASLDGSQNVDYGVPVKTSQTTEPAASDSAPLNIPSRDVAALVSALVSAPQGPARETALESLRSHKALYGDEELNAHLQQVSSPFRAFINDQLGEYSSPEKVSADMDGNSMSERLASLRSRLQATELVVQTVVDDRPPTPEISDAQDESQLSPSNHETPSKIPGPPKRSKLAQPSPSRLVPPPSRLPATSSQTLRERLAMAQENRKAVTEGSGAPVPTSGIGNSMGRAAALRARLEAVKKKGKSTP